MSKTKIILILAIGIALFVFLGAARIGAGIALSNYQEQKFAKNTQTLELTTAAIEGEWVNAGWISDESETDPKPGTIYQKQELVISQYNNDGSYQERRVSYEPGVWNVTNGTFEVSGNILKLYHNGKTDEYQTQLQVYEQKENQLYILKCEKEDEAGNKTVYLGGGYKGLKPNDFKAESWEDLITQEYWEKPTVRKLWAKAFGMD